MCSGRDSKRRFWAVGLLTASEDETFCWPTAVAAWIRLWLKPVKESSIPCDDWILISRLSSFRFEFSVELKLKKKLQLSMGMTFKCANTKGANDLTIYRTPKIFYPIYVDVVEEILIELPRFLHNYMSHAST